jgi:allantoinase
VPEFGLLDAAGLDAVLAETARLGALLIVHAEDPGVLGAAPDPAGRRYAGFLASRPAAAEDTAIAGLLAGAARHGARVHILHLASASALPLIAAARAGGARVTAETCPHYLTFCAEEVPDGATEFKCCPPIREVANRERLWAGLAAGTVGCVVSDHSPCSADLKRADTGSFTDAWGGISSLQLALPAVWTQARRRGYGPADVARWMAAAPAQRAGLSRKGRIAVGNDADFCVFAPRDDFVVEPARLQHRNPVTPYAGMRLSGVVRETWLAGLRVDLDEPPRGRLLRRGGES